MVRDKEVHQDKNQISVLFVDDEIEILNSIRRQLSFQDVFQGTFENDPTKVLELLRNQSIKIVVADIVMPNLDGITLLRQIKEEFPEIIRIMLTAHGDYNTSIRAINEADVFGFITKPWDKSYLIGHLEMASKVAETHSAQIIDNKVHSLTTMISYWDDAKGSEILSHSPESVTFNLEDIASRCFMSSSGFFGYQSRFDKKTFTMPLNDLDMCARLLLDKKDDRSFGIFVIATKIAPEIENKLDDVLHKYAKSFSSSENADNVITEFNSEIKSLFNETSKLQ